MKVLHLPTTVGGHSWGLSLAERDLGISSHVLSRSESWIGYGSDISLNLQNKNKIIQFLELFKAFLKYRKCYDIYHFNFGSSLIDYFNFGINLWDLPYYEGKKIMTYNGCDARQSNNYFYEDEISLTTKNIFCKHSHPNIGVCHSKRRDEIRRIRIKKVSKNVDHIFSLNPDLMNFLPKEKTTFLPYSIDGRNKIKPVIKTKSKKLKIIHSPTNRDAKGSNFIINSLEKLKEKYKNIEIEVVENTPHTKALKIYEEADIVVDQVLIGWYGGFGVEVMKMGKPLAVYIREEDLKFIPKQMSKDLKETIININPFNIEKVLSEYIESPVLLENKSKASVEYANNWHDPNKIAKITMSIYQK
tara:strand:- start:2374 stop:3450 length:1077 start_codon:yes stop_codon:yes gene_type:complete